jgi:broad specificity phosphatase PhoE
MRLVLVRHGETVWNADHRIQGGSSDTELSEMGLGQVKSLGDRFQCETDVVAVYSSPLKRALTVASQIAGYHGLQPMVVVDLREMEVGELEGKSLSTLSTSFDHYLIEWRQGNGLAKLPGGESLSDVAARTWAVVEDIRAKHKEGTVILVSHYFVILSIICQVLGMPLANMRRLKVDPAGVSVIDFQDGRNRLVALNDTCHCSVQSGPQAGR